MPSDPQAVLARHVECPHDEGSHCDDCGDIGDGSSWPCDAVLMARALAESEERADRLAAAIREFVSPSSSPHPFYGDPERDGHRSGAWPSSECEECERLRSTRWTNLRAALLEGEPDAV